MPADSLSSIARARVFGRSPRALISTTTLPLVLALMLLGAVTAQAGANSLLSGYGGPGQGNQAVLGSALLGGPPSQGGDSGSGSSAGRSGSATGGQSSLAGTSGKTAARPAGAGAKRHGSGGSSGKQAGQVGHQAGGAAAVTFPGAGDRSGVTASRMVDSSQTLGLSGGDLLYLLLAIAALAMTAVLTRQLARPSR